MVGLSNGPADAFTDLVAIVRLNTAGTIDVRKGSVYAADHPIQYFPESENRFRMSVNVNTHRYDVYWKSGANIEDWLLIADDYPFRTDQAGATRLDNFARIVDSATGSFDFCLSHVNKAR